jgi:hypothetical protein
MADKYGMVLRGRLNWNSPQTKFQTEQNSEAVTFSICIQEVRGSNCNYNTTYPNDFRDSSRLLEYGNLNLGQVGYPSLFFNFTLPLTLIHRHYTARVNDSAFTLQYRPQCNVRTLYSSYAAGLGASYSFEAFKGTKNSKSACLVGT